MSDNKSAAFLWGWAEFLPLFAFSCAGQFGADLATRFFAGAGLAAIALAIFSMTRRPLNPLLVALDAWMLFMAFAFLIYVPLLADALRTLQETTALLFLFAFGVGFTAFSRSGLFSSDLGANRLARRYSLALLGVIACAIPWAFAFRGDEWVAAVAPILFLFVLQHFLSLRMEPAPD